MCEELSDHLVKVSQPGKKISGGHDLKNFITDLNNTGGTVVSKMEKASGIYEIQYQLPNATKPATKTVYDPAVYPSMADMANLAGDKALIQYQLTGDLSPTIVVNGVKFSLPIRTQNGQPYAPYFQ